MSDKLSNEIDHSLDEIFYVGVSVVYWAAVVLLSPIIFLGWLVKRARK